jgi:hypothetical protein
MPQSLAQIYVHIVFSTKDRKPWLHDGHLCDQLYAYMATILCDNVDSPANFVADTVWNWMNDMLGIRTVPLGLNDTGGLVPWAATRLVILALSRPGLC